MGFFDRLDTLRNAPLQKRRMVAGITITIGMILVLGIWSLQLKHQFFSKEREASSAPSPFSIIMDALRVWER